MGDIVRKTLDGERGYDIFSDGWHFDQVMF